MKATQRFRHDLPDIPYESNPMVLANACNEYRSLAIEDDPFKVVDDEAMAVCNLFRQECDRLRVRNPTSADFLWNDRWQRLCNTAPITTFKPKHWKDMDKDLEEYRAEVLDVCNQAVKNHVAGGSRQSVVKVESNSPSGAGTGGKKKKRKKKKGLDKSESSPPQGISTGSGFEGGEDTGEGAEAELAPDSVQSSVFVYVWHSFAECRKFVKGFQYIQQALLEHSFIGLHVPFSLSITLQGSIVTVTPMVPLQDVRPLKYKQINNSLLASMMNRLPKALYVPEGNTGPNSEPMVHQGLDARWYIVSLQGLITPHCFSPNVGFTPTALRAFFMRGPIPGKASGEREMFESFVRVTISKKIATSLTQAIAESTRGTGVTGSSNVDLTPFLDKDFLGKAVSKHGGNKILLYQILVELEAMVGREIEQPLLRPSRMVESDRPTDSKGHPTATTTYSQYSTVPSSQMLVKGQTSGESEGGIMDTTSLGSGGRSGQQSVSFQLSEDGEGEKTERTRLNLVKMKKVVNASNFLSGLGGGPTGNKMEEEKDLDETFESTAGGAGQGVGGGSSLADRSPASLRIAIQLAKHEIAIRCVKELIQCELNSPATNKMERFSTLQSKVRVDVVNRIAAQVMLNPGTKEHTQFWENMSLVARHKFCAPTSFSINPSEIVASQIISFAPSKLGAVYDPATSRFVKFSPMMGGSTLTQVPEPVKRRFNAAGDLSGATQMIQDELAAVQAAGGSGGGRSGATNLTVQCALVRLSFQAMLIGIPLAQSIAGELTSAVEKARHQAVDPACSKIFALAQLLNAHMLLGNKREVLNTLENHRQAIEGLSSDQDHCYKAEFQRQWCDYLRHPPMEYLSDATQIGLESLRTVEAMPSRYLRHEYSSVYMERLVTVADLGFLLQKEKYTETTVHQALQFVNATEPVLKTQHRLSQTLLGMPTESSASNAEGGMQCLKRIANASVAFHAQVFGHLSTEAITARNILADICMRLGEEIDPGLRGDILLGLEILEGKGDAVLPHGAPAPGPVDEKKGTVVKFEPSGSTTAGGGPSDKAPPRQQSYAQLEAIRLMKQGKKGNLSKADQDKLNMVVKTNQQISKFAEKMRTGMGGISKREQLWEDACHEFVDLWKEEFWDILNLFDWMELSERFNKVWVEEDLERRPYIDWQSEHFAHYLTWTEHGEFIDLMEAEDRDKVLLWEQSDLQRVFIREEWLHRKLVKDTERTIACKHILSRLEFLNRRTILQEEAERRHMRMLEEHHLANIEWQREEKRFRNTWQVRNEASARRDLYALEESARRRSLQEKEAKDRRYSIRFMNFVGLEYALKSVEYWERLARGEVWNEFLFGQIPIFCEQKVNYIWRYLYNKECEAREGIQRSRLEVLEYYDFGVYPLVEHHETLGRHAVIDSMFENALFALEVYENFRRTDHMTLEALERDAVQEEVTILRRDAGTSPASRLMELNESKRRRDVEDRRALTLVELYSGEYCVKSLDAIVAEEAEHWVVLQVQMRQFVLRSYHVIRAELERMQHCIQGDLWDEEEKAFQELWWAEEAEQRAIIKSYSVGGILSLCSTQEQYHRALVVQDWLCGWYEDLATPEYALLLKRIVLYETARTWRVLEALVQDEIWARLKVVLEEREYYVFLSCSTFEKIVRDQIVYDWTLGWSRFLAWWEAAFRAESCLQVLDEQEYVHRLGIEARETCTMLSEPQFIGQIHSHVQVAEHYYYQEIISQHRGELMFLTKRRLLQQTEATQRNAILKSQDRLQAAIAEEELIALQDIYEEEAAKEAMLMAESTRREEERAALQRAHAERHIAGAFKRLQNTAEVQGRKDISIEGQQTWYVMQQEAADESKALFGFSTTSTETIRKRRPSQATPPPVEEEVVAVVKDRKHLDEVEDQEEPKVRSQIVDDEFLTFQDVAHDEIQKREDMFRGMVESARTRWEVANLVKFEHLQRWDRLWNWWHFARIGWIEVPELLEVEPVARGLISVEQNYRRLVFVKAQEFARRRLLQEDRSHSVLFMMGSELNLRVKVETAESTSRRALSATQLCMNGFRLEEEKLYQKYVAHSVEVLQVMETEERQWRSKELLQAAPAEMYWECMVEPVREEAIAAQERHLRSNIYKLYRLPKQEHKARDVITQSQRIEWVALLGKERAWLDCVVRWSEAESEVALLRSREFASYGAQSGSGSGSGYARRPLGELQPTAKYRLLQKEKEYARQQEEERVQHLVSLSHSRKGNLPPLRRRGEEEATRDAEELLGPSQWTLAGSQSSSTRGRSHSPDEHRTGNRKLLRASTLAAITPEPRPWKQGQGRRVKSGEVSLKSTRWDQDEAERPVAVAGGGTKHTSTKSQSASLLALSQSISEEWREMKKSGSIEKKVPSQAKK